MRFFKLTLIFLLLAGNYQLNAQEKEESEAHAKPRLKVLDITISNPNSDEYATITVQVENHSTEADAIFDLALFINEKAAGSKQVSLNALERKSISFTWKFQNSETMIIKAIADPAKKLNEVDRYDNFYEVNYAGNKITKIEKGKPLRVLEKDIDLMIEDLSVKGHLFQQSKKRLVTINFKVTNLSGNQVTTPFKTTVAARSLNFKKNLETTSSSLGPGQSVYFSWSIQNAPHQFDIEIKTDVGNVIKESDEENNRIISFYENPAPPIGRWILIGPDYITTASKATGLLSSIVFNPSNTNTVFVGSPRCGIWKTIGGGTWFPLTDNISMSVSALTMSKDNFEQVYWVTENEGVYRTDDGGSSWIQISNQDLNASSPSGKLIIHPRDPSIMLVKSNSGVYRSIDNGQSWILTLPGAACTGLEYIPATDVFYAALSSRSDNNVPGIYASYDRGANWQMMQGCPGGSLPAGNMGKTICIASSGATLFASYRTSELFQLYRTTTTACIVGSRREFSWEKAWSTTSDAKVLWGQLWAHPTNVNNLYLGGTQFWRSTNKGSSFSRVTSNDDNNNDVHVDHHGFAVMPGQPNTIFSLNDGGIYGSASNGSSGSWVFVGRTIANVLFYDMADATTKPVIVTGGTQDNGTIKYTGNLDWKPINGGDGATVDIDNTNENIMYSMNQFEGSIQRSTNGGGGWTNISNGIGDGQCFNVRYHLHPRKMNTLIAACKSLWKTENPPSTWNIIYTPPNNADVICSAIEPGSDLYLAGQTDGKVAGGVNGNNFGFIFQHYSTPNIIDIEIDSDIEGNIYLATDRTRSGRVYLLKKKTNNLYDSIDITSDLPINIMVQCLAIDRMAPYTVYIGHVKGVYKGVSYNNGLSWQWTPYMDGLPLADVRDLEINPVTGIMRAATFGRSMFEVNTDNPLGSVLGITGRINFLRIHDVGTKFGPPTDQLDAECIISLDTKPGYYFGVKLRADNTEFSNSGEVKLLRDAYENNKSIRLDYIKNGLRTGRIIRTIIQ